jgi:hypothetical protein
VEHLQNDSSGCQFRAAAGGLTGRARIVARDEEPGQKRGGPEIVKAVTLVMLQLPAPARKPIAWIHAPSQPLMRSLLSQFQTPTAPRRVSRFFRVWLSTKLPWLSDHPAYIGLAKFY